MTDKPTGTGTEPEVDPTLDWRVDGAAASGSDHGLNDTVVRLPPIREERVPRPLPPITASSSSSPAAFAPGAQQGTTAWPAASAEPAPVEAPPVAARPAPTPRPKVRRTRKARLRLSRLDPWSVMKTVFLFSIAFGIMLWVGTYVTWFVIENSGLFEALNEQVQNILSSSNDTNAFRIEDYVSTNKVLGVAALIAVINVVLMTAIGTLFAFLYNLSANILGGLELTLAED